MQARSDTELVMASRQGQVAAFGELVERYQTLVCGISFSAGRDRALSEDIAQETFVSAWSSLNDLREPAKVRPWLCQIARNLTSKALRGRKREVISDLQFDETMTTSSPLDGALQKESSQLVWDALDQIPETYREPLVLFYCQEQSSKQVAEQLDLTEAAVQQRLSRGRQHLKDSVAAHVEHALTKTKPSKSIAAAVVALIAVRTATSASAATSSATAAAKQGLSKMTMLKMAAVAAAAAITAGGLYWRHEAQSATPLRRDTVAANASAAPVSNSFQHSPTPPSLPTVSPNAASQPCPTCATDSPTATDDTSNHHREMSLLLDRDDASRYFAIEQLAANCLDLVEPPDHVATAHSTNYRIRLEFDHKEKISFLRRATIIDPAAGTQGIEKFEHCMQANNGETPLPADLEETELVAKLGDDAPLDSQPLARAPSSYKLAGPEQGPRDAPITIVEFTDFECSFCVKALATMDQLVDAYPGKIHLTSMIDPLKPTAKRLAAAAIAAQLQNKYWQMHDLLLAYQDDVAVTDAQLLELAAQIGLDVEKFRADLVSDYVAFLLQADITAAQQLGVVATPTIFINDEKLQGAQPIEVFKKIIDRDLAAISP